MVEREADLDEGGGVWGFGRELEVADDGGCVRTSGRGQLLSLRALTRRRGRTFEDVGAVDAQLVLAARLGLEAHEREEALRGQRGPGSARARLATEGRERGRTDAAMHCQRVRA